MLYSCKNCGIEFHKWMGQCNYCHEWNTLVELSVKKNINLHTQDNNTSFSKRSIPIIIADVPLSQEERFSTKDPELDRVLGGCIVPGSIILAAGDPGIGKSTLFLQLALQLKGFCVLYASGEESEKQIKLRAHRLRSKNTDCFLLAETYLEEIIKHTIKLHPDLLIIDSIQTLQSSYLDTVMGSVTQIRQCTSDLMRFAKKSGIPIILIGHITKDGVIAGPKILEHIVDIVLQFGGDRHHAHRILRAKKNRFGTTSELGIYEMRDSGLQGVSDPSKILTTQMDFNTSGQAVAVILEGLRPILVEVQALVISSVYGIPQRSATGFETKRLNMLLAVLEKRVGFKLGKRDVFLNVIGGIRVEDAAMDLALAIAILSSYKETPSFSRVCFSGEMGLNGEIRPVKRLEHRISEAERLGFDAIFISSYNKIPSHYHSNIRVVLATKIEEIFNKLF